MPDRRVRGLALIVVGLVISACGGGPVVSPGVDASPAASPAGATAALTAAPSVGATVEEAAAAYLAFVTDWNAKVAAINDQFDAAGDDPVQLATAWAAYVAVDQAYIAGIDAIDFPSSVAATVQAVRDATDERVRLEQALAADPTNLQLVEQMGAQAASVAKAGADLRVALGLPPAAASPAP